VFQATIGIDFLSKTMYLEDRTVCNYVYMLLKIPMIGVGCINNVKLCADCISDRKLCVDCHISAGFPGIVSRQWAPSPYY